MGRIETPIGLDSAIINSFPPPIESTSLLTTNLSTFLATDAYAEMVIGDGKLLPQYNFETQSQGKWGIKTHFYKHDLPALGDIPFSEMKGIAYLLKSMQDTKKSSLPDDHMHVRSVDFFRANWNTIRHIFSSSPDLHDGFQQTLPEVDFGVFNGQADLVGIPACGSLFVFEFGIDRERKQGQVNGYAYQLRKLFPNPNLAIVPFTVRYKEQPDRNILSIKQTDPTILDRRTRLAIEKQ